MTGSSTAEGYREGGAVTDVDVLVVGYGPVGALLAARLGAAGLHVLVVDRAGAPFPLPRAVAADSEVLELLERTVPGLTGGFVRDPPVRFLAADRSETARLQFPDRGLALFSQPVLERRLRAHVDALATVQVRLGAELRGLVQDASGVTADVDGEPVRAGWLVGCDGAHSTVRGLLGVGLVGRELPHRWLVCDVEGPPLEERQAVTYTCDPARPQVDMPVPGGHRWEWLLRDGPRRAGDLLARDVDPSGLRVVREVEYRFAARRARRWRVGRVLLAGDAAHTMPPFAGQGLGAGLRDAWALGALLPRGDVERYAPLRVPHLRRMTVLSLLLGTVVQAPRLTGPRDALLRGAFCAPRLGPWLGRGGPRADVSGVLSL
jgi:3-(3-hydroxy-phenyl)propionate hydroxylase